MSGNYSSGNFFKDAVENIRLNKLLSIATFSVFFLCFTITASLAMIFANINVLVDEAVDKNEIVIFLENEITEEKENAIKNKIETNMHISSYRFFSADEALKEYVASLGPGYEMLYDEFKDDNPLRASYRITLTDITLAEDISLFFRNQPGVAEVRVQQVQIGEFINIKNGILTFSTVLVVFLLIITFLIVYNTVKMAIYSRRTEINIMKYVGATDTFIRIPYIIEIFILGFSASVIAFFSQWLIYDIVILAALKNLAIFTPLSFFSFVPLLIASYLLATVLFAIFGTLFPMRRYLRV